MGRTEGHSEDLTEGRWVDQMEGPRADRLEDHLVDQTGGRSEDQMEGQRVDQTEDHLVDRMGVCSAAWMAVRVAWVVERRLLAPV